MVERQRAQKNALPPMGEPNSGERIARKRARIF